MKGHYRKHFMAKTSLMGGSDVDVANQRFIVINQGKWRMAANLPVFATMLPN